MSNFKITSHKDGSILFEGAFDSFQDCLEQAITQGTPLHHADLRNKNLSNSNLDDAHLYGADFTDSNLSGANLSESDLRQCNFTDVSLFNTCLAYSKLQGARFKGAHFGATDIVGADLRECFFSGLSCFSLNFIDAEAMSGSHYHNPKGQSLKMSKPPTVIMGLQSTPITYLDQDIKHGLHTEKRLKFK